MPPQQWEFHLPLAPEELLKSGGVNQYVVQEVLTVSQLRPQLTAFQGAFRFQGPLALLEHFDTFYSVLHHFRSADPRLPEDALELLMKVVSRHSQELPAVLDAAALSPADRGAHLNALKMSCYALTRLLESFEATATAGKTSLVGLDPGGKGRKGCPKTFGFDWEEERPQVLQLLTQLLQLDVRRLWPRALVEEEFVSLVTGCCYRLLENPTVSHQKNRATREGITHLLGVALTRYNHMLSATLKITQMLQHFEHVAPVLVGAVSCWATDYGMKTIVGEIVREIGQKCPQELGRDPAGAKGYAAFLTELAERVPAVLMTSMSVLLDHLDGESYLMRNAVLAAMAELLLQLLNGDQLDQRARDTRDQFLDTLQIHGHDVHSFVRSRVLQLFARIVQQKALPLTRFQTVVALAVERLQDKSVLVCKNAIQLLAAFLANNPFTCKLSCADLAGPLEKETRKLQELKARHNPPVAGAELDPEEEWAAMLPELKLTLHRLLAPGTGDEEPAPPAIDHADAAEQTAAHIRQLLAKASYEPAILLARAAVGHFQGAEPFNCSDPDGPEDVRLLSLLHRLFSAAGPPPPRSGPGGEDPRAPPEAEAGGRAGPEEQAREELVKQEMLVQYLQDAYSFSLQVTEAVGAVSKMMYENTSTVVQEAIEFFVTVSRFGVPQALMGVRRMLPLIWSKEPGIREAVLDAYRQLYLPAGRDPARAKAQTLVQNLSLLLLEASAATVQCLGEILREFVRNGELAPAVTQLLWEMVTEKVPCSPPERRTAVRLLGMMARGKPEIVGSNLDTLVSVGLAEKAPADYRLAREVCLAIAAIADGGKPTTGGSAPPFRLPQDHRLFEQLQEVVVAGFTSPDALWIPFAEVAVALVYQLAEGPEVICAQILRRCGQRATETLQEPLAPKEGSEEAPRLPTFVLSHLVSLAGDVALQQLVHLERAVSAELRRRRVLREEQDDKTKKAAEKANLTGETTMEEELGLVGASADDTEAELIRSICEAELLEDKQLLSAFVPLLLKVCNNPGLYSDPALSSAASLALGKFCMISASFCDSQLRLLFTLLEKSPLPVVRSNLMVAVGDLAIRFPNLVEPWTPHLYARLRDPAAAVRRTAGRVMTHLILKDLVKVKGQVSEMAVLLVDEDPEIAALAKNFFNELASKGNAVYNLLPDIISRLSDPQGGVEEQPFRTIMRQLLSYITKDKQTESLVEKLCQRFRTARTERQYRDLAHCLALLPLSERGLRKMQDNFDCFADKLTDEAVFGAFSQAVGKLRRWAKPEGKVLIDEFEQKLRAGHNRGLDSDEEPSAEQGPGEAQRASARPSTACRPPRSTSNNQNLATPKGRGAARTAQRTQKAKARKKAVIVFSSDEESSSQDECSAELMEEETPRKTTPIRRTSTRSHRA